MSGLPWIKWNISDYLAATTHLSAAEHGAYCLLLMRYYLDGGLPTDEETMRRIAHMTSRQWAKSRDTLAALFQDGWKHKRADEEILKQRLYMEKNRDSGRLGGDAKARNRTSETTICCLARHQLGESDVTPECSKALESLDADLANATNNRSDPLPYKMKMKIEKEIDKKDKKEPPYAPLIAVADTAPAQTVSRKVPRRPMPDDFSLSDQMLAVGNKYKLTPIQIRFEFEKFTAHARMTGRMVSNWNQAWRMWVIKAREIRFEKEPFSRDRPVTITSLRSPA